MYMCDLSYIHTYIRLNVICTYKDFLILIKIDIIEFDAWIQIFGLVLREKKVYCFEILLVPKFYKGFYNYFSIWVSINFYDKVYLHE